MEPVRPIISIALLWFCLLWRCVVESVGDVWGGGVDCEGWSLVPCEVECRTKALAPGSKDFVMS